ncbi:uncharacterized protein [Apostichopus japonicus]|uniref:uncharacterized protein n=1 Tax=Stichopus japonicus TaxID=307972 RepID=UPI003AB6516A
MIRCNAAVWRLNLVLLMTASVAFMFRISGPDDPCEVNITGLWADGLKLSVDPNPPRLDVQETLNMSLYVYEDLWFGTFTVHLENKLSGETYENVGSLCGKHESPLCPLKKGETLSFHETAVIPSTFVDKGIYSGNIKAFNEDDVVILGLYISNCSVS